MNTKSTFLRTWHFFFLFVVDTNTYSSYRNNPDWLWSNVQKHKLTFSIFVLAGHHDGPSTEDHLVHSRHREHGCTDGSQEDDSLSQRTGELRHGRDATHKPSTWRPTPVQDDLPCFWIRRCECLNCYTMYFMEGCKCKCFLYALFFLSVRLSWLLSPLVRPSALHIRSFWEPMALIQRIWARESTATCSTLRTCTTTTSFTSPSLKTAEM